MNLERIDVKFSEAQRTEDFQLKQVLCITYRFARGSRIEV